MADTSLLAFVAAALVVLLIPGPGVLYVVARSGAQGSRAGLASVLGLSLGALVHVAGAAAGLSALLLTSATAFTIVKLVGAAYLVYLGLCMLLDRSKAGKVEIGAPLPYGRLVRDGVIVSVFNPKPAIFFLAFLPQFVDPASAHPQWQVLALGLLYVALAVVTDGAYALLAGSLGHVARGRILQGPWPRYVCGGVYIGLGLQAALAGRRQ